MWSTYYADNHPTKCQQNIFCNSPQTSVFFSYSDECISVKSNNCFSDKAAKLMLKKEQEVATGRRNLLITLKRH